MLSYLRISNRFIDESIFLIIPGSNLPIFFIKRFLSIARNCKTKAMETLSSPLTVEGSIFMVNGKRRANRLDVHGITITILVLVSATKTAGRKPRCSWPSIPGISTIQTSPFFMIKNHNRDSLESWKNASSLNISQLSNSLFRSSIFLAF